MTINDDFIRIHRTHDVRTLMLKGAPSGVDLLWCARQIEGWQLAKRKLPRWAETEGLWYPPRLSMEQCSSNETAQYKRLLLEKALLPHERTHFVDLTGGLAVDFSAISSMFQRSTYVEMQPHLCELARHNLPLLGLPDAEVMNTSAPPVELWAHEGCTLFLDPARRDGAGRKTVALEDCTPNVLELQPLWQPCRMVVIKLSPMLDIADALRRVENVSRVHVVSLRGECRELLLVVEPRFEGQPTFHCVSLAYADAQLSVHDATFTAMQRSRRDMAIAPPALPTGSLLFEPGPSLLKADCQDAFAQQHGLRKLHPMSNLFIGSEQQTNDLQEHGRAFRLEEQMDFGKQSIKAVKQLRQANLTLRNFPGTVDALRRQLKLSDGGHIYLFATTLSNQSHALLRCSKITDV